MYRTTPGSYYEQNNKKKVFLYIKNYSYLKKR